jgi:lipopolysaccharide/colanic/teichoic acid biosynthesis glycosyltransferase
MKRLYQQLFLNIFIALLAFGLSIKLHQGGFFYDLQHFGPVALLFYGAHILISLFNRKYEYKVTYSSGELIRLYSQCWLNTTGAALLILVTFQITWISRQVLLTNIFGLLIGEMALVSFIRLLRKSVLVRDPDEIIEAGVIDVHSIYPSTPNEIPPHLQKQSTSIFEQTSSKIREYITKHFDVSLDQTLFLNKDSRFALFDLPTDHYHHILNLHKLNNIRFINKFLEAANSRLPMNGTLLVCAETTIQRKARIMRKYPPVLNGIYYLGDYVLLRVFPKLPVAKKIYFFLTKGDKRVISRPEILGRLCSCGFEIADEQEIDGLLYVVGRKKRLPVYDNAASYGPLIYLNRIGKDGKMLKVFKIRTMHPYSEYLQDYIYAQHNLADGGKIKKDYRVTLLGIFLRKFWLDELPMLWNLMKGEIKLVGVRPISKHYFSLYSSELQQKRIRYKTGLIPPFYADMPGTLDEIMASEMKYLDLYEKSPLKTDFIYFFKSFYNIVFRRARSR